MWQHIIIQQNQKIYNKQKVYENRYEPAGRAPPDRTKSAGPARMSSISCICSIITDFHFRHRASKARRACPWGSFKPSSPGGINPRRSALQDLPDHCEGTSPPWPMAGLSWHVL